jgi:coenzyme F420 hydrogenase subunit beta
VGSTGSPNGYSTVIVRSQAGKKLLENLDIIKAETEKKELSKLANFKKQRAENEFRYILKKQDKHKKAPTTP